jgi:hypothetical protein
MGDQDVTVVALFGLNVFKKKKLGSNKMNGM